MPGVGRALAVAVGYRDLVNVPALILAAGTGGAAAAVATVIPGSEQVLREVSAPSEVLVVAWGTLPALAGGSVWLMVSAEKPSYKHLGELAASAFVGFVAAAMLHERQENLLYLGGICGALGLTGSAGVKLIRAGALAAVKGFSGGAVDKARKLAAETLKKAADILGGDPK